MCNKNEERIYKIDLIRLNRGLINNNWWLYNYIEMNRELKLKIIVWRKINF